MSAYQIMEDMSVFRYRLIVYDEQEYTGFVIWPGSTQIMVKKKRYIRKTFGVLAYKTSLM